MTATADVLRPRASGIVGSLARAYNFMTRWPVIPIVILVILILAAIFAPVISEHEPLDGNLRERLTPPWGAENGSANHVFGTDHVGRDIFSRVVHGSRVSLMVAAVALVSGTIVGTLLGLVAGYFGGITDEIIMRIVDIWFAFPFLMIALLIAAVVGQGVSTIMGLLALLVWSSYVRYVRAEVLTLRERDYVSLARVAGASTARILIRHLLPGVTNTVVVVATLRAGQLVLAEASLSFLGAGVPPPTPTLGSMIADGRDYLRDAWWISVYPGITIFLMVMSLNFLGDWLRDRIDPRLRQL
jgi:peptide/nickel transport system permease protein